MSIHDEKLTINDEENYNDELGKMKFNQYIYDNIMNNSNNEMEINKNELIKEIQERVENGINYIEQINSYFGDRDSLKISEMQNIFNSQRNSIYNYSQSFTDGRNTQNNFYSSDLDFLSSDLPKDKNRAKILKPTYSKKINDLKKKKTMLILRN